MNLIMLTYLLVHDDNGCYVLMACDHHVEWFLSTSWPLLNMGVKVLMTQNPSLR